MTQQSNWQAQAGIGPGQRGERATGWAAWISFAAVLLAVVGVLQIMQGLTALLDEGVYLVGESGLVLNVDYTLWGWAHMLLGVLAILVAAGLLAGNTLARVVGIGLAMVSAVLNLVFLPAHPWWSVLAIVFYVFVIYGLTAHGGEMKHRR
jgi:hypothetical protein